MVSRGKAAVQNVKCSAFSHIPLKHIPTRGLQSPLPNFHSSPSSASQAKYSDFALREVFPLDSLALHFWDIFHLCLSGYKITKIRHHIKERKTPWVLNNWQSNFHRFVRSLLQSDLTGLNCRATKSWEKSHNCATNPPWELQTLLQTEVFNSELLIAQILGTSQDYT